MAKITGLSGMIRGKVGPNVFRISRGVQVVSQYNPSPNNPRSPSQQDQRAIFGQAAGLTKAMYDDEITGKLVRAVQYKPRHKLMSETLKNKRVIDRPFQTPMLAVDSLAQNWSSALPLIPYYGASVSGTGSEISIKVQADIPNDGTSVQLDGFIMIVVAQPEPEMSYDDMQVFGLPPEPIAQGVVTFLNEPAMPGTTAMAEFTADQFQYIGEFQDGFWPFPPCDDQSRTEIEDGQMRGFFIIPLSDIDTGHGLRIELNGRIVSVGHMQLLWAYI